MLLYKNRIMFGTPIAHTRFMSETESIAVTDLPDASDLLLTALANRAVNGATNEMASEGVLLTHEEAASLGEEVVSWIGRRFCVRVIECYDGVAIVPAGIAVDL